MVTKKRPIHNVEQNEAGGEKPPGDSVHQHGLFALLLHHVPDFFLTLELYIVYQAFDALRIYHIWVARQGRGWSGGQDPSGQGDGL